MEHTSDIVYDGKLLHETSYPQRPERYEEILISADYKGITLLGQIDYFDKQNHVVHEIKRSNKVENAHNQQVKFYLWLLELNGIEGSIGLLEYPKLHKTEEVSLEQEDRERLKEITIEIKSLIKSEICPPIIKTKICKSCSYYEFCYVKDE